MKLFNEELLKEIPEFIMQYQLRASKSPSFRAL